MPAGAAAAGGAAAGAAGELALLLLAGDAGDAGDAGELAGFEADCCGELAPPVGTAGAGAGLPAMRPTLPGCAVIKATWGTVTWVLSTEVVVQPEFMLAALTAAEPLRAV